MMVKMKPAIQKSSKGYLVHCPQCGQFLMVLSKGEAVIHCPQCGTDKKAIIRGGRITIFELSELPGAEDSKKSLSGRQRR
jgi:ribosomal protein S27E